MVGKELKWRKKEGFIIAIDSLCFSSNLTMQRGKYVFLLDLFL